MARYHTGTSPTLGGDGHDECVDSYQRTSWAIARIRCAASRRPPALSAKASRSTHVTRIFMGALDHVMKASPSITAALTAAIVNTNCAPIPAGKPATFSAQSIQITQ